MSEWLGTYQGPVIQQQDPLGRFVTKWWVQCRDCSYETCEKCGGTGGRYEVLTESNLRDKEETP